jgi:putative nucleotidyltransferase with HDIG domain
MKRVIKSIGINEAKKNMVLANSIRDHSGNIVFEKGEKLDYNSISLIRKEGVHYIYIYEFVTTKEELLKKEKILKEELRLKEESKLKEQSKNNEELANNINDKDEAKYSIPASFSSPPPLKDVISIEMRKKGEKIVKELFNDPSKVEYNKITELVSTMVEDILDTDDTVISVQDLRDYDNYTYQHSVNLSVLGVTVGKLMGYQRDKLKEFGLGLLFHDFGKTKIPLGILNKPDRLTNQEFDIMKNHAEYGYQILSKKYKLPEITKMIIRHHHEKLDGTGYPHGLKGTEIPEWVQIAAIVDIYDALTADRIYKTKWTHQKAIEFLFDRSDKWFNKEYIKVLQNTLPDRRESFSLLDF